MRCSHGCSGDLEPLPDAAALPARDAPLAPEAKALLTCRRCGAWMRPHVLWFDECYDEENYRIESAVRAGREAELLLVVGTSGATTGPNLVVDAGLRAGAALVDVNPERDPFAERAERQDRGAWVRSASVAALPGLVGRILGQRS
jgi:NAD-dependent deacetylase